MKRIRMVTTLLLGFLYFLISGNAFAAMIYHDPIVPIPSVKVKILVTAVVIIIFYIIMRFLFYVMLVDKFDMNPKTALAFHYSVFLLFSLGFGILMFFEYCADWVILTIAALWLITSILTAVLL